MSEVPLYYDKLRLEYKSSPEFINSLEVLLSEFIKTNGNVLKTNYYNKHERFIVHALTDFYYIKSISRDLTIDNNKKEMILTKTRKSKIPKYTLSQIMQNNDLLNQIEDKETKKLVTRSYKNKFRTRKKNSKINTHINQPNKKKVSKKKIVNLWEVFNE